MLSLHYWVTCGKPRDTMPELHPSIDQTLSSETLLHVFRAIYMYKAVYMQINALVPLLHVSAIFCGHLLWSASGSTYGLGVTRTP
jgi:hypothetical protein